MMNKIKCLHSRKILNSHVEFTNEFFIELDNDRCGIGSSPQGETTSIYEDGIITVDAAGIVETVRKDGLFNVPLDQSKFDHYLKQKTDIFGRNNAFALSLAFFNATNNSHYGCALKSEACRESTFPKLCMNILNGGAHAYTNPVLSDFHEYLLVAKDNRLSEMIDDHRQIQRKVRENLMKKDKIAVRGNMVNRFAKTDNRECIDFLLGVLSDLNMDGKYDLMIDASAGDLCTDNGYRFSLTDNSLKTNAQLCQYWMDLIEDYKIRYLEDPFHEKDFEMWKKLTTEQSNCNIISDNLYSADAERIENGSGQKFTHGTVIKPNQAGTVSATIQAIQTAQKTGQIVITSHRSISTESTFLSLITQKYHVEYIKIGPLCTDFSSVIRLNEIIRLCDNLHFRSVADN
jgi:enolase